MSTPHCLRRRAALVILAAAVTALAFATLAVAAEFSADIAGTMSGQAVSGKFYVKGSNVREEVSTPQQKMIMISRPDKKVAWMIYPTQKTYMEMTGKVPDAKALANQALPKGMGTRKLVGKEKVNGYLCDKYVVTLTSKGAGTLTQWISPKLGVPVKMAQTGGNQTMTIELKNIKEGGVANSLFAPPKGYKKQEMPGMQGKAPKPAAPK
jgi:outer membrane lipoprotein-sorting protein